VVTANVNGSYFKILCTQLRLELVSSNNLNLQVNNTLVEDNLKRKDYIQKIDFMSVRPCLQATKTRLLYLAII